MIKLNKIKPSQLQMVQWIYQSQWDNLLEDSLKILKHCPEYLAEWIVILIERKDKETFDFIINNFSDKNLETLFDTLNDREFLSKIKESEKTNLFIGWIYSNLNKNIKSIKEIYHSLLQNKTWEPSELEVFNQYVKDFFEKGSLDYNFTLINGFNNSFTRNIQAFKNHPDWDKQKNKIYYLLSFCNNPVFIGGVTNAFNAEFLMTIDEDYKKWVEQNRLSLFSVLNNYRPEIHIELIETLINKETPVTKEDEKAYWLYFFKKLNGNDFYGSDDKLLDRARDNIFKDNYYLYFKTSFENKHKFESMDNYLFIEKANSNQYIINLAFDTFLSRLNIEYLPDNYNLLPFIQWVYKHIDLNKINQKNEYIIKEILIKYIKNKDHLYLVQPLLNKYKKIPFIKEVIFCNQYSIKIPKTEIELKEWNSLELNYRVMTFLQANTEERKLLLPYFIDIDTLKNFIYEAFTDGNGNIELDFENFKTPPTDFKWFKYIYNEENGDYYIDKKTENLFKKDFENLKDHFNGVNILMGNPILKKTSYPLLKHGIELWISNQVELVNTFEKSNTTDLNLSL